LLLRRLACPCKTLTCYELCVRPSGRAEVSRTSTRRRNAHL